MSTFKVGDTVDPRTLPVGAKVRHDGFEYQWVITSPGFGRYVDSPEQKPVALNAAMVLLSLPQPLDEVVELGTLTPTGDVRLCVTHWAAPITIAKELILDRRAKQTSTGSDVASSLPTYDQIAGWLGAEWVMNKGPESELLCPTRWDECEHPSPWWKEIIGFSEPHYRCWLRHTSGQRVEVAAPKELAPWCIWFRYIRDGFRGNPEARYAKQVRWLDPDSKTITGSSGTAEGAGHTPEAEATPAEPVVLPTRQADSIVCSSCKREFWLGRPIAQTAPNKRWCGDCLNSGCLLPADHLTNGLDTRIAEVAPEVEEVFGAWATPCDEGLS